MLPQSYVPSLFANNRQQGIHRGTFAFREDTRDQLWTVFESGAPSKKVDLLFLGDGYAADEIERFREFLDDITPEDFEAGESPS